MAWGEDDGGSVWGRHDVDKDVFGNPSKDAWGNPSDRTGWGDVGRDAQGSDWSNGASDIGGQADGGGIVEGIVNFLGGLFGG